jgi:hypothetical protein
MLRRSILLTLATVAWVSWADDAAAQHERRYEFDDTHVALSIERVFGIDYTAFEEPGTSDVKARILINASEPVPTTIARVGFDVFIERLSLGLAGGVASDDVAIIAPRVGYLFGLTPNFGLWLRGGAFYAAGPTDYFGISVEALFAWFPYSHLAFHFGPTLDLGFAEEPGLDYTSIGIPEVGLTAWF